MNQREWYEKIKLTKQRHLAEIEEVKRLQREELNRLYERAMEAEPVEGFSFAVINSAE